MDDQIMPLFPATLISELTSTLQAVLTAFEQLPALTALDALSSIPEHPYEQIKYDLYGPNFKDYKFKTIDDVPVSEDYDHFCALQNIIKKGEEINCSLMHNLTCAPEVRCDTTMYTVSGDQLIPNTDKQMKQVEFLEMVLQMPVDNLSDDQLVEYSKKLITEYIKIYD